MSTPLDFYHLAAELRVMGLRGLHFSHDEHDRVNYARLLDLSAQLMATLEHQPVAEFQTLFHENDWSHIGPAHGAEAAVVREGRLLLIQRKDSGLWALPGGLVDVGETLAAAAVRELREETGLAGRATQLLAVFDSCLWGSRRQVPLQHSVFAVEALGEPGLSNETLGAAFWPPTAWPPLHPGHDRRVPVVWELLTGARPGPYFD